MTGYQYTQMSNLKRKMLSTLMKKFNKMFLYARIFFKLGSTTRPSLDFFNDRACHVDILGEVWAVK